MSNGLDPYAVRDQLKTLLQLPLRDRPAEWDDQVARAVGLLSVDYPVQAEANLALEELALIKLAAQRGNKAAKARVLSHTRWKGVPPPQLSSALQSAEERKAALKGLTRVRAPWVLHYVLTDLAAAEKSCIPDLIVWAVANADSAEEVVRAWSEQQQLGPAFAEVTSAWIGAFLKSSAFNGLPAGDSFLEAVSQMVATAEASAGETKLPDGKKSRLRLQAALVDLLGFGVSKDPKLFLRPAFSGALTRISALATPPPRAVAVRRTSILERAAAVLALLYSVAEVDSRRDIAKTSQNLAAEYEGYRKYVEALAAKDPAVMALLVDQDLPQTRRAGASIEDALGSLLSDVDDICRRYPGDAAIQQLRERVGAVADEVNVREFGREGEEASFNPMRHVLAGSATGVPGPVIVRRPGVVSVRADGSERVLVKAVVEFK